MHYIVIKYSEFSTFSEFLLLGTIAMSGFSFDGSKIKPIGCKKCGYRECINNL